MSKPKVIVIGDVHGCYEELADLVLLVGYRPGIDRVIMLGDLLDKGPMPLECLRYVRQRDFAMVASNHEERHVRWWRREQERQKTGKPNPMKPWPHPEDEATNSFLHEDEVAWLESLPPWLEIVPGWVAVHGGFNPKLPLAKQDPKKVIRMRYVTAGGDHVPIDYDGADGPRQPPNTFHWTELWQGPESVIYGHEAFSLSQVRRTQKGHNHAPELGIPYAQTYGIDTGVVHGGHLTALIFEDGEPAGLEQVKAKKVYQEPLLPIPA